MKKIAIVVAILALTAPAMAVNVTIGTNVGADCNVTITYTADSNISAFALDCNVGGANTITDIDNYFEGESTTPGNRGFGIFPGTIDINSVTGQVDHNGIPVAPNDDPGALGGLDTNGVTLEMGALYEDGNQPAWTGILCELTVGNASRMTISLNSTRGGIVKEDSNDATTNLPITVVVPCVAPCIVPNVLDMNLVDANAALDANGLGVGSVGTECNETIALGNVLSMDPNGGAEVSCGSNVDLVLSLGNIVPNVLNSTETDANSAITAAGFVASIGYGHDCSVTSGNVISQNPTGGATPDCGSTVNITVADGDTTVPGVVNSTEADANAAITAAGLSANITYAHDCSVTAGNVISQNPTGTTEVSCGSTVDISVADGDTTVPGVVNQTEASATSDITAAGLSANVTYAHDCSVTTGNVISQNPTGTTEVSCGSTVNISVADGNVLMPNILGMTRADANNAIITVGLVVGTIDRDNDCNTYAKGTVMAQDPAPGTELTCNPGNPNYTESVGCYPWQDPNYNTWVSVNEPNCWCFPRQCHGDVDNVKEGNTKSGYFYVWSADLTMFNTGWKQPYSGDPALDGPDPDALPDTWICADFAHNKEGNTKTGYFRVWSTDLTILVNNWKTNPQANCPANCPH